MRSQLHIWQFSQPGTKPQACVKDEKSPLETSFKNLVFKLVISKASKLEMRD